MIVVTTLSIFFSFIFQIIAIGCMIRFGVQTYEFGLNEAVSFGWMVMALLGFYAIYDPNRKQGGENESHQ